MANSKKSSLKVLTDDGRLLHGTAAQLRYISEQGGWDEFIENTTREAAEVAVSHALQKIEKAKFRPMNGTRKSS